MSHLKYFNYPGGGDKARELYGYSQAVRVGDRIECSGQGGWDPTTFDLPADTSATAQIEQAFKNVDIALRHAGGKGWSQVFRVTSYHVPINDEALAKMASEYQKWMPDHRPIWTAVGVPKLGLDSMKVEIEVAAHVGGTAAE